MEWNPGFESLLWLGLSYLYASFLSKQLGSIKIKHNVREHYLFWFERRVDLAILIFFLANKNGAGNIRDQCCHLHGDGAPYK